MTTTTFKVRRVIKGEPYLLTLTIHGWRVTPLGGPLTDRFHRNYLVTVRHDGQPVGCSCPQHLHRGVVCKHMDEVLAIVTEVREGKVELPL